jgi:hypothetical protein
MSVNWVKLGLYIIPAGTYAGYRYFLDGGHADFFFGGVEKGPLLL